MSALLDTNACIAVINGNPRVRERFKRALRFKQPLLLSSVSLFELWYGVAKSTRKASNSQQITDLCEVVEILPFDADDARSAAFIRADLVRAGRSFGSYDLLIAAQAIRRNLMLVTADRDFAQFKGLRLDDWAR